MLDHIPVMVFMFHFSVGSKKEGFRWDQYALVQAMNDLTCPTRSGVIMAVEKDLEQTKMAWRELRTETTVDPMWDLLSTDIVIKVAKHVFSTL